MSGRFLTQTHILCSSIYKEEEIKILNELSTTCNFHNKKAAAAAAAALASAHHVSSGQGPVIQAGPEVSDHVHDLIVGDGGIHLLENNMEIRNKKLKKRSFTHKISFVSAENSD